MPIQQTFTASRNATWAPALAYVYAGGPLPLGAGSHIAMQVRLYAGAADPALLVINPITWTDVDNGDGTRTLTLNLGAGFTPAQLEALPGLAAAQMAELAVLAALPTPDPPDVDAAQCFAFDILITYTDATTEVLSFGSFTVQPGVTTV